MIFLTEASVFMDYGNERNFCWYIPEVCDNEAEGSLILFRPKSSLSSCQCQSGAGDLGPLRCLYDINYGTIFDPISWYKHFAAFISQLPLSSIADQMLYMRLITGVKSDSGSGAIFSIAKEKLVALSPVSFIEQMPNIRTGLGSFST